MEKMDKPQITFEDMYLLEVLRARKERVKDPHVWRFLEAGIIDGYRIHQEFIKDRDKFIAEKNEELEKINGHGTAHD